MGSHEEEYSSSLRETPNETKPESLTEFNSDTLLPNLHPGSEKDEENLAEDLKKVILGENDWNGHGDGEINSNGSENLEENNERPLRPYAEDCSFYLKTGHCKFGSYCRFNHPVRRGFQDKENHQRLAADQQGQIECKYYRATGGCKYGNACRYRHSNQDSALAPLEVNSLVLPVQAGINEKMEKDGFAEQTEQIECKYYLTSGGCKYGKACRYSHSKEKSNYLEKSEIPPLELNFLGLPIRTLEKECPYYMRTGSCAYGSGCRFNHPDPTAGEGSSIFSSDPTGFGNHSPGNYNGEYDALPSSIEPSASSLSFNMLPNEHSAYLNPSSAYAQGMHANSKWNGHQEKASNPYLAPSINKARNSGFHQEQIQVDEYPERPGEPECPHFVKTGYCKFKSACKFHHPLSRLPKPIVSHAGLPLRPERRICWNYEKSGICKYGSSCHFHHPENLLS
ncbi:hypothetical protein GQ457_06G041110 [Hibiscus cannabinus]